MNTKEAIKVLRTHNRWRRGERIRMPNPTQIGLAIDKAIEVMDAVDSIRKHTCETCGSKDTYNTLAYHCNSCASTHEV